VITGFGLAVKSLFSIWVVWSQKFGLV